METLSVYGEPLTEGEMLEEMFKCIECVNLKEYTDENWDVSTPCLRYEKFIQGGKK